MARDIVVSPGFALENGNLRLRLRITAVLVLDLPSDVFRAFLSLSTNQEDTFLYGQIRLAFFHLFDKTDALTSRNAGSRSGQRERTGVR